MIHCKLLIVNFLILISYNSYAQEYTKFYYPDSTVSSEGYMYQGKPDGYWKNYYTTGILKSIGKRTNFELDSIWKFYDDKGNIQKEISYLQGKKNGEYKEYGVNNAGVQLYSKIIYINDLRQGNAEFYNENGKIIKIIPFVNDAMEGQSFEYNSEGIITAVINYKNNELLYRQSINRTDKLNKKVGTWMEFYPNGNIKTESNYVEGKLNGTYKLFDTHQRLLRVGHYQGDSLLTSSQLLTDFEEPFEKKEFYSDSVIKYRGSYKDIIPIGIHRYYNKQGKIESGILYDSYGTLLAKGIMLENGNKEGFWTHFYANGIKESEGNYTQNEKYGLWKFYYPDGVIKQEGYFSKNKFSGVWKWYFELGVLQKQEEYAMGKRNGISMQYNEQGKKITEGMYVDNREQGLWVIESGDIITRGTYEYGSKIKTWESYFVSGKLQFRGTYFNGKPQGKHQYFYSNGKLEHEEIYSKTGKQKKAWSYYNKQGELLYIVYYKNGKENKIVTVPEKK